MTATAIATNVTVRRAVPGDVPWLLPQLREFADGFGSDYEMWPGDDDAELILRQMIGAAVFFVAVTEEGMGVGYIVGHLAPHYFNPRLFVLSELAWWVAPEHRGSRAGLLLLNAFLEVGDRSAHWVSFTLEAKSPVNERTLTRRGFTLYERAYLREVTR